QFLDYTAKQIIGSNRNRAKIIWREPDVFTRPGPEAVGWRANTNDRKFTPTCHCCDAPSG
ncbi:hypothetical protein, partial [Rhodoblastus sp.]|uniref:hypothetical protein n=1 Tax=Rhodoblastus sp. TaxID=1962975 RepID=UPI0035B3A567